MNSDNLLPVKSPSKVTDYVSNLGIKEGQVNKINVLIFRGGLEGRVS